MQNFLSPRAIALPTLAIAATALSACSYQSYGHGAQYAEENCNVVTAQNCGRYGGNYQGQSIRGVKASHKGKSRYGSGQSSTSYQQYAYAQPQMMLRTAPLAPPVSYQQPTYQAPSYSTSTTAYTAVAADCPAGTTAQADGTCLQGSSVSYASTSTVISSYSPSYSSGYITSAETANCPAGTTAQSDGTCLQGGSVSYSSSSYMDSTPTYSSSTTTSSTMAPSIGSYDFSEYNWGSTDTTWGATDYVSPGTRTVDSPNSYPEVSAPSPTYWPVRK